MRRMTVAALGLGLALALAACGGSPDGDRGQPVGRRGHRDDQRRRQGGRQGPQEAALDFARCMREHGIDMPDPEVDDTGRIRVRIGAGGPGGGARPDPRKLEAAQEACGGLMGGGDGDRQLDPAARDAMVAFARCMREHGIDMPDPTGDGLLLPGGRRRPRPRVVEVPRGRAGLRPPPGRPGPRPERGRRRFVRAGSARRLAMVAAAGVMLCGAAWWTGPRPATGTAARARAARWPPPPPR